MNGPTNAAPQGRDKAAASAPDKGADKVTLSAEAQEMIRAAVPPLRDLASLATDARQVLDALYADAKKRGTFISYIWGEGEYAIGKFDVFSDRALAAITVDKTGRFSKDEREHAEMALRDRVQREARIVGLLWNPNDVQSQLNFERALAKAYDSASQEIRDAIGWTAQHRANIEWGMRDSERQLANRGKPKEGEEEGILEKLRKLLKQILMEKSGKASKSGAQELPGEKTLSPQELFALLRQAYGAQPPSTVTK